MANLDSFAAPNHMLSPGALRVVELAKGVREGDILVNKYRVERVLGAGAMGVVVAAHHLGLDTRVAIKLLHPQMLESKEVVARFAREARAAAKITSEHVARVIDVGQLEGGAPFIVMELLDGADLQKWLEHHGPLPIEQAVDFVLQASEAIAEAHRLGIVHRDLKPSNLFCVPHADGTLCVKVVDFGISKMASASGAGSSVSMTRTTAVIGTPLYMSPEQMESSRGVDARADVWALGVILFELLTGKSPFFGEGLPEVCLKIATRPPPPMRGLRADVPPEIEAAILKCLEKDREKRCQSVADLCAAIASFGPPRATASAERIRRTMQAPSKREALATSDFALDTKGPQRTLSLESIGAVGHTRTGLTRRQTGVLGALGVAVAFIAVASTLFVTRLNGRPAERSQAPASASSIGAGPMAAPPLPAVSPVPAPTVQDALADPAPEGSSGALAADAGTPGPVAPRTHKQTPAPADVSPKAAPRPQAIGSPSPPSPPAPQAPSPPEPAKGSSAYDERL